MKLQLFYNWLFATNNEKCDRTVMDALAQGIKTTLDLADATGLGLGGVYTALNRLEKQGLVWSEWRSQAFSEVTSEKQLLRAEESAIYRGGNRRKYYYLMQEKIDYWAEQMQWGKDGR